MGKKKTPKNAFYFFFTEIKDKQTKPISNDRAVEIAAPLWNRMTPEQRKPYEDKAKLAKGSVPKETCAGESIYSVLAEEKSKIQKEHKRKNDIETIVKLASSDGSLPDTDFYLLHINSFFYHDLQQKYFPAEIAMGKFNLKCGINQNDVYHNMVYPGRFPIGYALTARQKADESHKLPTDFGDRNNIKEIVGKMIEYYSGGVPIFIVESEMEPIEKMLDNMFNECDMDMPFNIYPLDYLLFTMNNIIQGAEKKVWPVVSLGTIPFEKDVYSMNEDIPCLYHHTVERQSFCSKSKVIRWAYTVCDICSVHLGIKLIPGCHVPSNSDVTIKHTNSSVASSSSTLKSTESVSKAYEFDDDDSSTWSSVHKRRGNRPVSQMSNTDDSMYEGGSQSQNSQHLPLRLPRTVSEIAYRGRGRGRLIKRPE